MGELRTVIDVWGEEREEEGTEVEEYTDEETRLLEDIRLFTQAERAHRALADRWVTGLVYQLRHPFGGDLQHEAMRRWRAMPWSEIGQALATTGEAARQRFGEVVRERYRAEVAEFLDHYGMRHEETEATLARIDSVGEPEESPVAWDEEDGE